MGMDNPTSPLPPPFGGKLSLLHSYQSPGPAGAAQNYVPDGPIKKGKNAKISRSQFYITDRRERRERERDGERDGERETERQTDRKTERQTETEREEERERERERDSYHHLSISSSCTSDSCELWNSLSKCCPTLTIDGVLHLRVGDD